LGLFETYRKESHDGLASSVGYQFGGIGSARAEVYILYAGTDRLFSPAMPQNAEFYDYELPKSDFF
jgi:hypothetical protein